MREIVYNLVLLRRLPGWDCLIVSRHPWLKDLKYIQRLSVIDGSQLEVDVKTFLALVHW